MTHIEKEFANELQYLLDRYKNMLSTPQIMRIAQPIFHKTLSIRYHPERFNCELDYLKKFITEGPQLKVKFMCIDEFEDYKNNKEIT